MGLDVGRGDLGGVPRAPRVLMPVTILFAVRYLVRTGLVDLLSDACTPVLALSWDDPSLVAELEEAGLEVLRLPDPRVDPVALDRFRRLEEHFQRRLASPSTRIDRARSMIGRSAKARLSSTAATIRAAVRTRRPGDELRIRTELAELLPSATNLAQHLEFLDEHQIDVVCSVTPFTVQERVILLAAERSGRPTCTSILSFDNITTRPPLPIAFDRYLVWNRFNRDEILRSYHGSSAGQIEVVGPAQFDFYRQPERVVPRAEWADRLGVGSGPTVLYGAGAAAVVPHETQYVDHLCAAVEDGRLPADLQIVLRRHPVDPPGRWERFRGHPAVVFDEPGRVGDDAVRPGQVDLGDREISGLCSSLAHTDVHVNASSTMTIDGAFFGKPQIGPAYDVEPGRRHHRMAADLYRREHFEPIVASGGLELASTPDELVALVGRALDEPARLATEREVMLDALCTYTDGACTERVAASLRAFIETVATTAAG